MEIIRTVMRAVLSKEVFVPLVEAAVGTLVICFVLNAFILPFRKEKRLRKARTKGHCVKAKITNTVFNKEGIRSNASNWTGFYAYEYHGRRYRRRYLYSDIPPAELDLYFSNSPRKAAPEMLFGKVENEWIPIFLMLSAVSFITNIIL